MNEEERVLLFWTVVAYGGAAGVALIALLVLYVLVRGLRDRWLPLPRLRRTWWTGHEVLLAFCIYIGLPYLIFSILFELGFFRTLLGPAPDTKLPDPSLIVYIQRSDHLSWPLTLAVVLAILFGMLYARTHSRPHHYGLTWSRFAANVAVGLVAFLAATPIIFGVHYLASLVLLQHSNLIKLVVQQQEPWEWPFFGFRVIAVAALLEEILIRGLLQGWLRRASLFGHLVVMSATLCFALGGIWYLDLTTGKEMFDPAPLVFGVMLVAFYGYRMVRLTREFGLAEAEIQHWQPGAVNSEEAEAPRWLVDQENQQRWTQANARLAIYGSAMLWAVMHSGAWPAPLALFFMGIILGWLYQRTQSLVGPITFHAMFNVISFVALYLSLL